MERKIQRLLIVLLMVLISGLFLGCAMLRDFKPASPDEASIKNFFVSMENAWNNKDVAGALSMYDDNAKIMTGKERRIISKEAYAESLKDTKSLSAIKYGLPRIKVNQDRTKAKVDIDIMFYYQGHDVVLQAEFSLVRSGSDWLIMKRTYTY